jgi:hypothetical protein
MGDLEDKIKEKAKQIKEAVTGGGKQAGGRIEEGKEKLKEKVDEFKKEHE